MIHIDHSPPDARSASAAILPFPAERTRPPASGNGLLDRATWSRMFMAFHKADQFRGDDSEQLDASIAAMIVDAGAGSVARILKENTAALGTLRAIVASLEEADRRLAAAADAALRKEGA